MWSDSVYLVPRNDGRILAGATVEYVGFDKQVSRGQCKNILDGAMQIAPALQMHRSRKAGPVLRPDSPDHLPIIGPAGLDGLLVARGHFRSGILLAPITARLIREWITMQNVSAADWTRFSPMRFVETSESDEFLKIFGGQKISSEGNARRLTARELPAA